MDDLALLLAGTAVFVPLAAVARTAAGGWLRPAAVFAAYWMVAGILPLAFFTGSRTTLRALVYIAVGVAVFSLGALIGAGPGGRPSAGDAEDAGDKPDFTVHRSALRWMVGAGTAAGFAAGLLALRAHGLPLTAILSAQGLLDTGNTIATARYSEGATAPVLVTVLLAVMYGASLVAPYLTLADIPRHRYWILAPAASALFYSTVTTERLGLLISVACTAGGYLGAHTLRTGDVPRPTRRGVLAAAAAALLVAIAFTSIAFVRAGRVDTSIALVIRSKLATYAFAYEPAFSGWLAARELPDAEPRPLGWGTASVAGVSLLTGQSRADTRAYHEFTVVNETGQTTNIYTIFRSLLIDFGRPGAVLVLFGFGLAAGAAYRRATRHRSAVAATALSCCYAVIGMSNTMSILTFTNVCAGLAGGALFATWAMRAQSTTQWQTRPDVLGVRACQ